VKWSKLLIVVTGVALLLPIIYVTQQQAVVLRRSDVLAAVQPLVAIPLGSLPADSPLSKRVAIPSGGWWKRMVKSYGEPKILIAAVNVPIDQEGRRRRVYRSDEVDLAVAVSHRGSLVPLEHTTDAPYGYSSEEQSDAWLFRAVEAERLTVTVARHGSSATSLPPGELVVVPDWPRGEIASAFDGFGFIDSIRWLLVGAAAIGIVLLTIGFRAPRL
jgi:hypothetical protein